MSRPNVCTLSNVAELWHQICAWCRNQPTKPTKKFFLSSIINEVLLLIRCTKSKHYKHIVLDIIYCGIRLHSSGLGSLLSLPLVKSYGESHIIAHIYNSTATRITVSMIFSAANIACLLPTQPLHHHLHLKSSNHMVPRMPGHFVRFPESWRKRNEIAELP